MKKRVDMSGAAFAITLAIAVMLVCMVFVGYPRLETLGVALFVSVVVLLMLMALLGKTNSPVGNQGSAGGQ